MAGLRSRRVAGVTVLVGMLLVTGGCGTNDDGDKSTSNISSGDSASGGPATEEPKTAAIPLPFNADGLLKGSIAPKLADGEPGEVSVLKIGKLDVDSGTLPFAFRNNTDEAISHVDWTAKGRSAGALVGTGTSQGTIPAQIAPGAIGFCVHLLRQR